MIIQWNWFNLFSLVSTLFSFKLHVSIAKWFSILVISNLTAEDLSELLEYFFQFNQSGRLSNVTDIDLLVFILEYTRLFHLPHHSNVILHYLLSISFSSSLLSIFLLMVSNEPKSSRSTLSFVSHNSHWKYLPVFLEEIHEVVFYQIQI